MISRINKEGAKPFKPKPCSNCGSLWHTAFNCLHKPRKPLNRVKRMRKIGNLGQKQKAFNKSWLDSVPDDHLYCFYCRHVGIEQLLTRAEAQPEHFMSRARHPELRFDPQNMVVSCAPHNEAKKSLDGFEFMKLLDKELAHAKRLRTDG